MSEVDGRHPAEGPPQQVALGLEAESIEDVPLLVGDVQREQRPVDRRRAPDGSGVGRPVPVASAVNYLSRSSTFCASALVVRWASALAMAARIVARIGVRSSAVVETATSDG